MKKSKKITLIALILFVLALSFAIYQLIPKHNVFVRTGNMNFASSEPTTILLHDGRVLVLGNTSETDSAEIYNPKKKRFKLIEGPSELNAGYSATLLQDEKVMIAGYFNKADLFDPKTNKFSDESGLNYLRCDHTATLLKDGRVLITGGRIFNSTELVSSSEIYNPKTKKFEIGPKLNTPRYEHNSILLNDGNVLIVGGKTKGKRSASAEIYDIKSNRFIKINDMKQIRVKPQILKLDDGKVVIIGGYNSEEWNKIIEFFEPKTNQFSNFIENNLTDPTSRAVVLKNGNVLFIAGDKKTRWYYSSTTNSAILNPEKKIFSKGGNLKNERGGALSATVLNDGTVLIIGGAKSRSAELYIP